MSANFKLTLLSDAGDQKTGSSFALTEDSYEIGRTAATALCIPDGSVSSHHAILARQENGGFALQDTQSTNGTWVNGTRLEEDAVLLQPGDVIRFGSIEMRYDSGEVTHAHRYATSKISLEETGTVRMPFKNLSTGMGGTTLRENQKSNRIIYILLGVITAVVIAGLVVLLPKMLS